MGTVGMVMTAVATEAATPVTAANAATPMQFKDILSLPWRDFPAIQTVPWPVRPRGNHWCRKITSAPTSVNGVFMKPDTGRAA
ncbi:MAG: hypothetical protein AMXMBFR58_33750 [Phycisphaerae bacterium]